MLAEVAVLLTQGLAVMQMPKIGELWEGDGTTMKTVTLNQVELSESLMVEPILEVVAGVQVTIMVLLSEGMVEVEYVLSDTEVMK
jgi:hypothetical protein